MKHVKTILFLGSLIFFNVTIGQIIQKGKGKVKNETFSYSYIAPAQEIKGILILLPGWGESTQSIYEKTKLPYLLLQKDFVTVVPELHQTLFADDYTIAEINELIKLQLERYNSKNTDLIIGGLSAGGAIAIHYAEYILNTDTTVKLKAVFAIDPPLDLNRMYTSAENKISYNCKSKLIRKEGSFIKNYLLRALGGSPQEKPGAYVKYSAYSANAQDGGNAGVLKKIPIRLYSEPDLEFVRKTYCDELQYEDINAVDLEKMNIFLKSIGNDKSEYITTKGKGFHSWNILEPIDCVNWILKNIGE
ncbi:MAG TPA: alpha/beta hydrolase [Chitinophagaceae bacterium]|nr:alpha/beta hydrolase [Chitinophagaceae bacterium]